MMESEGRWGILRGWEAEGNKAGRHYNNERYGLLSPEWLDDYWLTVCGSGDESNQEGEKEYHKGVKMLRKLSAAAVVMCHGVWKAAGLVWAQQSRDEATRLRLEDRLRRVERARVAASAVSIARRWREVDRERQWWLRREQKRGAIRGLQEVVDRAREAGYPRGTQDMRVFQQHTHWSWKRILQWWGAEQGRRVKQARLEARRATKAKAQQGNKRQRTLVELWGHGRGGERAQGTRPPRKPPDTGSRPRRDKRAREEDDDRLAQPNKLKKKKKNRRVTQFESSSDSSGQIGRSSG